MAARDEAAAGGSAQASAPAKKKRNLPGNPNPDAEVIALSPKTLMATNRFVCEVCSKGFQREQNLQLHRRGHNLPWKLKQKSGKEARRRVYLCPEPTCVHHDPSRALGDLTGIKKHFCRKHGEKKWKCDKCSKRYAVQSDWKAHSKTCGTREYRCDCGTLFSRRDSFITHRAFCDALAHESSRMPGSHLYGSGSIGLGLAQVNPHLTALHNQSGLPPCMDSLISPSHPSAFRSPPSAAFFLSPPASNPDFGNEFGSDLFNAGSDQTAPPMMMMNHHFYNQAGCSMHSLFDTPAPNDSVLPQMSATALLQKAAQMGATSSTNSRNETHLQDIMNSFANGNSGIFSGGQQQEAKFGDFNVGFCGLDESNYHGNGLTRDFLGVGSLLRNLGGGVSSQREQQQNHGVVDVTESLNSEMKPASLCHSFAGGGRLR